MLIDWLCWGLTTRQPLRVILCRLPEKGRKEIEESRGDEREGQGRKRNRNESEETEEIKTFPLYPYPLQGQQALPNCKPISVGRPSDDDMNVDKGQITQEIKVQESPFLIMTQSSHHAWCMCENSFTYSIGLRSYNPECNRTK